MAPLPKGRPTVCLIDSEALRWNFRQVRETIGPDVKILSVVKANGYGHGASGVARVLEQAGTDLFGVATLEEGVELRQAGIRSPIILLAGVYPEQVDELIRYDLTPAVSELAMLRSLEMLARGRGASLNFHLKVDTGMGRIGFIPVEIDSWLQELAKLEALKLQGLFSHFSHADSVTGDYTRCQLEVFGLVINKLHERGYDPPFLHIANSAAVITFPEAYLNLVRPGLMLYGIHPSPETTHHVSLRPALSWKTRILQIKRLPAGASISYGRTFITPRESVIGTLPVGYADGYSRLLSNRGVVLVRGKRAPIVGRLCMDLTMVDLTEIPGAGLGDEAVLLGRQGGETISADEMAGWADTISYEILTSIGARVPRVYYSSKED
ncbi:MAG: alanine racemase [Deltaproteobacteria bacterium]|nr:alanine racemase [Deltaproteobacteria bacterium]